MATVVVNWNEPKMTIDLLVGFRTQSYPRVLPIVIDNGSLDQSDFVRRLAAEFPDVSVIANATNTGYAAACNGGIAMALERGADYVFILNNDVALDPSTIGELVRVLRVNPEAGAAAPIVYDASEPERVWFAGGRLSLGLRPVVAHVKLHVPTGEPARQTDWLSGAAIMMSRACIETVGLLKTDYFLYLEDVDWSCRARRDGFTLLIAADARVRHRISASTSKRPIEALYYSERSLLLFFERWGSWPLRCWTWAKLLFRLVLSLVRRPGTSEREARQLADRDYLFRRLGARPGFFV